MNSRLIRSDILEIEAYKPGKPIAEVQRELGIRDVIKLASNENALGPSPKAARAVARAGSTLHRYPEGSCFYLKKKLAARLKIKDSCLLFGNGSDELIDVILKTVKAPGAEIITGEITFVEYKICGQVNGFAVKTTPLRDFSFDLDAIKSAVSKNTKAVFIANPNNPTGTYLSSRQVLGFLDGISDDVLVVFDEAYREYCLKDDFPDLIPLAAKRKNVVVLRTFSKIYGLAGLRIGYMIAHPDFVACAQRVRQPFNVNSVAQAAAFSALDDTAFIRRTLELIKKEKEFLGSALRRLGIWFAESAANFIFIRVEADARELYRRLLKRGIIIREMSQYHLNHYARVTIGTRRENQKLIKALEEIMEAGL